MQPLMNSFNRPIVELKYVRRAVIIHWNMTFNRPIVELKYPIAEVAAAAGALLIVP